jgi:hypothetical protein
LEHITKYYLRYINPLCLLRNLTIITLCLSNNYFKCIFPKDAKRLLEKQRILFLRNSDIDEIEHRMLSIWEGTIVHTKFTLSSIGFWYSIELMFLDVNVASLSIIYQKKNLFDSIKYKVAHIYVSFYV